MFDKLSVDWIIYHCGCFSYFKLMYLQILLDLFNKIKHVKALIPNCIVMYKCLIVLHVLVHIEKKLLKKQNA